MNEELVKYVTEKVLAELSKAITTTSNSSTDAKPILPSGRQVSEIPVGISGRHIHLSREHLDFLFGQGYQLTKTRDLPQPGEFVAEETVTLVGPRLRALEKVRILGDLRPFSQVEISRTEAHTLGMKAEVRKSGNLTGTPGATVVGPQGTIVLTEGVIIANRHIHMNYADAERFGVRDGDEVDVRVISSKPTILGQVQIRIGSQAVLYMHLDLDDANASAINEGAFVEIMPAEVSKCCWQS